MEKAVKSVKVINKGGTNDGLYFFGMIGAAVYFVQQASGFGEIVVALLKACVWPAYLVYHLLG